MELVFPIPGLAENMTKISLVIAIYHSPKIIQNYF